MWLRRKFCSMSNCFHLAVEAGDLEVTRQWYVDVLGCELDMQEEGKWQDIDFFGNELTLHSSTPREGKGPRAFKTSCRHGCSMCSTLWHTFK